MHLHFPRLEIGLSITFTEQNPWIFLVHLWNIVGRRKNFYDQSTMPAFFSFCSRSPCSDMEGYFSFVKVWLLIEVKIISNPRLATLRGFRRNSEMFMPTLSLPHALGSTLGIRTFHCGTSMVNMCTYARTVQNILIFFSFAYGCRALARKAMIANRLYSLLVRRGMVVAVSCLINHSYVGVSLK